MKTTIPTFVVLVLSVLTLTGAVPSAYASDPSGNQTDSSIKSLQATTDELILKAQTHGPVRVIVGLKVGFQPEGERSRSEVQTQRTAIQRAQIDVLSSLASAKVSNVRQFDYVPYLAMEVDAVALAKLKTHPAVSSIQEDIPVPPTLAESVPLTNTDDAWLTGFTGGGYLGLVRRQDIAILDTGVQGTHEFLTSKVVSEACYSTTSPANNSTTVCPNGLGTQIGAGAGVNCNLGIDGCDHGTHVAGIAAGANPASSRYGVARGSGIIAIQVFSRFFDGNGRTPCANVGQASPCTMSFPSDQIRGLDRVFALRNTFNIAAVNMSLGGGRFTSNCDDTQAASKASIDNLRAAGIATIIAAGNDGHINALAAPACISTAISVGSTDDGSLSTTADRVSNFSNSASFLSLLAPGQWINSSVPGVGTYANFAGTSMAAPHVAGAWAVLKSVATEANISVSEVLAALQATGVPVTDTRNNVTKPRIRVNEAIAMLLPLHPRMMADVDGDGRADVVGFGYVGVYVSRSTATGFTAPQLWGASFGYNASGWRAGAHPRMMADVNGDGRADVVGFANAGVYVSLSTGTGFTAPQLWVASFGYTAGGWRVDKHPRMMADVNDDGRADVVGFADAGVYVSLSTGTGLTVPQLWVASFGYTAGGWQVDKHPRMMADVNGDGRADVVGFANAGVYVSRSTGTGFTAPQLWVANFGYTAGGWRVEAHPRMLADVNGDGWADIVGFGHNGVYVSRSRGTDFSLPFPWTDSYGYSPRSGSWQVGRHPRMLADINADGLADIVGFGNDGVYVSRSTSVNFTVPELWNNNYGYNQNWR